MGCQAGVLENSTASMAKKSPRSATLLKDSLRSNLSPTEATAQLRVLCRKFAALTEKVKVGPAPSQDANASSACNICVVSF